MCLRLVQSQKCKQMLKHLFLKVYVWTICFPITKKRIQLKNQVLHKGSFFDEDFFSYKAKPLRIYIIRFGGFEIDLHFHKLPPT